MGMKHVILNTKLGCSLMFILEKDVSLWLATPGSMPLPYIDGGEVVSHAVYRRGSVHRHPDSIMFVVVAMTR